MTSKLLIYEHGKVVKEIEVEATTALKFVMTDTTQGDRTFNLKVVWPWNEELRKKTYDRPKGLVLT